MRIIAAALVLSLACAAPALAQNNSSSADQIAHASRALAAIWRPITTTTQAALTTACAGASDDLAALDASLPQDLNNRTLAAVHVAHGLAFVPTTENPADAFVFADSSMAWLASGVAVITSADENTGNVVFQDAAGVTIHLQLGHVAGQLLMRLTTPGGNDITFAGCASTLQQPTPARNSAG